MFRASSSTLSSPSLSLFRLELINSDLMSLNGVICLNRFYNALVPCLLFATSTKHPYIYTHFILNFSLHFWTINQFEYQVRVCSTSKLDSSRMNPSSVLLSKVIFSSLSLVQAMSPQPHFFLTIHQFSSKVFDNQSNL